MPSFEQIARFYDLDTGAFTADLPMYVGFARRIGGPVLEVACGTGRVVAALAQAGFSVTGVDHSAAMLAIARQRLEPFIDHQVQLIQADAQALDLPSRFQLAIVALDSFLLFGDIDAQARALRAIRRALAPDGLLIIDIQQPEVASLIEEDRLLILDWIRTDPVTGRPVVKTVSRTVDLVDQRQRLTVFYDEHDPDGTVRRTIAELTLHYLHRGEAELLLARCGFHVEQVYGSYDLEPVGPDSERLIFVARRPIEEGDRPDGSSDDR